MAKTIQLTESELKNMIIESVKKILKEGQNDNPSNTHYAIHKPTNKIVFSWDYSGYDPAELRQYKKDYFLTDLIDMGMDSKEITVWTRRNCMNKGIDPTNDSNWSNYPLVESKHLSGDYTTSISIDEIPITDSAISEWFFDNLEEVPNTIDINISYEDTPYDGGDYWTPPSGGLSMTGYEIIDNDLTAYLKQNLSPKQYKKIISDIYKYIERNIDELFQHESVYNRDNNF